MSYSQEDTYRSEGAFCPSCERFIGPADVCPYCEADSAKSPLLRVLRIAAILLGVGGLIFVYLAAVHRELPVIKVEEITPMMNFAYVRVSGEIDRDAFVARKEGKVDYVSFLVDDGTGKLRVAVYKDVASVLVERNKIPRKGSIADVAGALNVSARGVVRMRLQSADQLWLRSSKDEAVKPRSGIMNRLFGRFSLQTKGDNDTEIEKRKPEGETK